MSTVNEKIKEIRMEFYGKRGKAMMCKDLQINTTTYQGYEKDTNPPYIFFNKLCNILNINNDYFNNDINKKDLKQFIKKPGKDSRDNKSKEGRKKMEGKLYDVEGLNQEKINILQEMIDSWKQEELNKRQKDRQKATPSKSQKNNTA